MGLRILFSVRKPSNVRQFESVLRVHQQRGQLAKRVLLEAQRQVLQVQVQVTAAAQSHLADGPVRNQSRFVRRSVRR